MRRAFVIVLDACGAGALPDAAAYGDAGSDTLGHLAAAVGGLDLPALQALGLGCALDLTGVRPVRDPVLHGRLAAIGPGKDSTAGHWGLMGLIAAERPVYPQGFPDEVLAVVRRAGVPGVLGNHPSNGIEAIERYGEAHLLSGEPILYTSQDSVLQIAAHVDVITPADLYALCALIRTRLPPQHAVGRVIARPFTGETGGLHAHRRPPRLRAGPGRAELPRGAAGRRRGHACGRQGPRPVRRRRLRYRPSRGDQRGRAGRDRAVDR